MSWLIILPIFAMGFVCGACWMRARQRDIYNRRALQIGAAVDRALSQTDAGSSRKVAAPHSFQGVLQRSEHSRAFNSLAIVRGGARTF